RPGERVPDGVRLGDDSAVTMGPDASIEGRGLPALRWVAGREAWVVGEGEPAASVEGSPFDVFRAMTGRRSANQIRALDWDGDADLFVPAFGYGPFTLPETDLVE